MKMRINHVFTSQSLQKSSNVVSNLTGTTTQYNFENKKILSQLCWMSQ